jgi:TonB family protein
MKPSRHAKLALVVLALLAAHPAHAQRVGDFYVVARTDSATGEDRSEAMLSTRQSGAQGGLLIWNCVAAGGLVVDIAIPGSGRVGEVRPVAYRFDDEPWDSATVSKLSSLVSWYLSADHVAPFTLRAKQARRLVIRGRGGTGTATDVEYVYDLSRGGEALDRLSCARGTPTPGRSLRVWELPPRAMDREPPSGEGGPEAPPDEGTYSLPAVEVAPQIRNRREMQRLIEENFPASLQGTGVTGRVVVRFRVMEDGTVDDASVNVEESTHEVFNEPAMMAVRRLRLTPAKVGGRPVKVWVTVPITFQADLAEPDPATAAPPAP